MPIGDSVYLELADDATQQQALNAITSCSSVRKETKDRACLKNNVKPLEKVKVSTQYLSAIGAHDIEKVIRLIRVTKTDHYTI